jgi:hypothetical protein
MKQSVAAREGEFWAQVDLWKEWAKAHPEAAPFMLACEGVNKPITCVEAATAKAVVDQTLTLFGNPLNRTVRVHAWAARRRVITFENPEYAPRRKQMTMHEWRIEPLARVDPLVPRTVRIVASAPATSRPLAPEPPVAFDADDIADQVADLLDERKR